jgi:hypothetical protein
MSDSTAKEFATKERPMSDLKQEIAAFDAMRAELERDHKGQWALVHDRQFVGAYESFDHAAAEAVAKFGRGPFLIRQVGAPPATLPASVMYHPIYETNPVRIQ